MFLKVKRESHKSLWMFLDKPDLTSRIIQHITCISKMSFMDFTWRIRNDHAN